MEQRSGANLQDLEGKRLLGIDYGEKVTGLASYAVGRDPYPLLYGRVIMKECSNFNKHIAEIIDNECIDLIIMGLPYFTDGKPSKMTEKIKKVGKNLASFIEPIELIFQDETLSSYEAQERMKNDPRFNFQVDMKKIDALAASIIIEEYLLNR